MGKLVSADCRCGFSTDMFMIGRGIGEGPTYAPCICTTCRLLGAKEYYAEDGKSPREVFCKHGHGRVNFLNESRFYRTGDGEQLPNTKFPWDDERKQVYYHCPACGEIVMRLIKCGNWD